MVSDTPHELPRLNILVLDGGGVRGLSALLILQELMRYINDALRRHESDSVALAPRDIFSLVGGTSTGGLIALMLGKLGMSIEECIEQYHKLATTIFQKKHMRGRFTRGLGPSKYSGKRLRKCVGDLLAAKKLSRDLPIMDVEGQDAIPCAVVCREHELPSRYSDLKSEPVCICSHVCANGLECLVCDAARATSSAPTFFPVTRIGERYFVDGGVEYNNPSSTIHYHYGQDERVRSRRTQKTHNAAVHGSLDFRRVRYVNLGTGSKDDTTPPRHRDAVAAFVPGFIRYGMFLKTTLTQAAVNSERDAARMESIATTSSGKIEYERFSATNGLCWIKLDKYLQLKTITELTQSYIQESEIREKLKAVGEDIAKDYLDKRRSESNPPAPPSRQAEPSHSAPAASSSTNRLNGAEATRWTPSHIHAEPSTPQNQSARPIAMLQTLDINNPITNEPSSAGTTNPESGSSIHQEHHVTPSTTSTVERNGSQDVTHHGTALAAPKNKLEPPPNGNIIPDTST